MSEFKTALLGSLVVVFTVVSSMAIMASATAIKAHLNKNNKQQIECPPLEVKPRSPAFKDDRLCWMEVK